MTRRKQRTRTVELREIEMSTRFRSPTPIPCRGEGSMWGSCGKFSRKILKTPPDPPLPVVSKTPNLWTEHFVDISISHSWADLSFLNKNDGRKSGSRIRERIQRRPSRSEACQREGAEIKPMRKPNKSRQTLINATNKC